MSLSTKIGIIGTGNMGRALGVRFAQSGHQVFFGARDLAKAREAADLAQNNSQSGSVDEAADFGSVLLWTMREAQPSKVLRNELLLEGKVVVDLNNRDYATEARSGAWFEHSIAEQLQENAPTAHVVKAFNTIAMESFNISTEALRTVGAQTFLAGRDKDAKALVIQLAHDLGFDAIDLGFEPASFRAAEALGDVIRLLMIDGKRGGQAHLRMVMLPGPDKNSFGERQSSKYA